MANIYITKRIEHENDWIKDSLVSILDIPGIIQELEDEFLNKYEFISDPIISFSETHVMVSFEVRPKSETEKIKEFPPITVIKRPI